MEVAIAFVWLDIMTLLQAYLANLALTFTLNVIYVQVPLSVLIAPLVMCCSLEIVSHAVHLFPIVRLAPLMEPLATLAKQSPIFS
jgi:hypothetical protein